MPSHDLLKSQRNEVLLLIRAAGFDASEFRWQEATSRETEGLKVPQLLHESSRYYFRFDLKKGKHYCEYSPGTDILTEGHYPGDWELQAAYCSQWLANLRREVDAPDLWSNIAQEGALFGQSDAGDPEDNSLFSNTEKARIAASVDEVKKYFEATHPTDPQRLEFVNERLAYLVESSERLGRKDWKLVALGALTNIIVGVALAPDAGKDLLRVAAAALGWLFGGSPLLPQGLQ